MTAVDSGTERLSWLSRTAPHSVQPQMVYRAWGDVIRAAVLTALAQQQAQLAFLPFGLRVASLWQLAQEVTNATTAWQAPNDDTAFLGIGSAWQALAAEPAEIPQLLDDVERFLASSAPLTALCGLDRDFVRAYGGLAFASGRSLDDHPAAAFRIPAITLRKRADAPVADGVVAIVVEPGESAQAIEDRARHLLAQLVDRQLDALATGGTWQLADPQEGHEAYCRAVEGALAAISDRQVDKVVLSRDLTLTCTDRRALDRPWQAFATMAASASGTARYALDFGTLVFGASPERLVAVAGGIARSDCLAGTRSVSPSLVLAHQGGPGPSGGALEIKERREHDAVSQAVYAALAPLSDELSVLEEPVWKAVPGLSHLWSSVTAKLAHGVRISQVVTALHPTPAVGGWPKAPALELIGKLEGRSRGWYAGAVGWIGNAEAEFAVAIRGLRWQAGGPVVVVGAGIVEGSSPEGEWEETQRKAEAVVALLGGAR